MDLRENIDKLLDYKNKFHIFIKCYMIINLKKLY